MKAIQANPKPIRSIFGEYEFVIPEFQRPYSWEEEHCSQLWDDISHFCQTDESKEQYFLGSIVVYPEHQTKRIWHVVDGQQRITTLMILIKVLFEHVSTMKILEKFLYRENPNTGKRGNELRLQTRVQAGSDRDDTNDLQVVISQQGEYKNLTSHFKKNYDNLKEEVGEWWKTQTAEGRENFITTFLDNVVLLPIECDSIDDALELFQIINDRGMQLSDSDIFKSKIYGSIKSEEEKNSFVERWGKLKSQDSLFRLFMHISRAKQGNISKETNLRKYVLDNHLNNKESLAKEWKSIMRCLELCHWVLEETETLCDEEEDVAREKIYMKILNSYTNVYWQYPVFVFLHKYITGNNSEEFHLPRDKQSEYIILLKDTIRYFFIKGVVYNNVNRVRDTTFKVYVAINKGDNYTELYRKNTVESNRDDIAAFNQRLDKCEYGRYRTGLLLINSIPRTEEEKIGDVVAYAKALEKPIHIEHILPRKWNDYDCWTQESHAQNIDKLGNLIPLERKINIAASNEFFQRKQEKYADSDIRDVLILSKKEPSQWYPEDVEKRHEQVNKRLMKIFSERFGS